MRFPSIRRRIAARNLLPSLYADDPFAYKLFAETFSAYLRRNPSRWRLRRTDTFSPLDLSLAQRTINLDLRIDRRFLNEFIHLYGSALGMPYGASRNPDSVTAFVPVLSHPKELLLCSEQKLNGSPVTSLQRYDESRILARDLLSLLYAYQQPPEQDNIAGERTLDPNRAPTLRLLIAALVFNDPHRLAERLGNWESRKPYTRNFRVQRGLTEKETLLEWIKQEGDEFLPDLGSCLVCELSDLVAHYVASDENLARNGHLPGYQIDSENRPGGLAFFPTVELLLLHGIQDLLKMTVEVRSPRTNELERPSERSLLVSNPKLLAIEVRNALAEAQTLCALLRAQRSSEARDDFFRHLDRWVSYAVVTFRPSIPFSFTHSDVFRLDKPNGASLNWLQRFIRVAWKTEHHYPLALKDAMSVHVEVRSDETEIIAASTSCVVRTGNGKTKRTPQLFGQKVAPNKRLVHRYSSKRPFEGSEPPDEHELRLGDSIFLQVRYKLLWNVKIAYITASTTFAAASAFVAVVSVWSLYDGHLNSLISEDIVTGSLATTLGLWLITTQYRTPIIHRKLFLARYTMYASVVVTVASLVAFGGWRLFHPPTDGGKKKGLGPVACCCSADAGNESVVREAMT